jgi:tetratricopeptide (TPR) repeat protein
MQIPRRGLWVSLALAGLTLAAFYPALRCGFVYYDDPAYVYENPHLRDGLSWAAVKWAFTAMHASNWHPLTWLSHALDCELFGLNPAGHHATNLVLHTTNVLLLFAALRCLTGAFWRSALVAALFAVHPLRVESVAWVSERKDVLSVCFGLLALLAYGRYAVEQRAAARRGLFRFLGSRWYWLTVLAFVLSLLSKPMLVTLPCLLLLLDFWPLRRMTSNGGVASGVQAVQLPAIGNIRLATLGSLGLEKLPLLGLVAALIPLTVMAQAQGGSVAPIGDISPSARLANSAIAVGWYAWKLVWPVDLAVIYPLFPHRDPLEVLGGILVVVVGTGLAIWQMRARPQYLTGWFWFLGTLVPVIGLVQVGMQRYADRYTYFSYIGLFILLAWALAEWANTNARRRAAAAVAVMVVLVCAGLARQQCHYWQNSETLFGRAVRVTENNYVALNNFGYALAQRKEYDQAIRAYEQAITAAPRFAEALNNWGVAHLGLRQFDLAADRFRVALEIQPDDPRTLNNLGTALHEAGDFTNAVRQYERAIAREPAYAEAHYNLANSLAALGDVTAALAHYERALALQPAHAGARLNYGVELYQLGRAAAAEAEFKRVLADNHTAHNAHFWLAALARDAGRPGEEQSHLQEFLAVEPDHVRARVQLAMALAAQGQAEAALGTVQAVLEKEPNFAPAYYCLGVLREQGGQITAAVAAYKRALEVQPDFPEVLNNLAWLLAASHEPALRNGPRAVMLAQRACDLTKNETPLFLGTLAAALAEAGRFREAIAAAEHAIARATAIGDTGVAQRNRELLELYRRGESFHLP